MRGRCSFGFASPFAALAEKVPNAVGVLPAMGYGPDQIAELEETIRLTPCDLVLIGTPIDLGRILKLDKPMVRARYDLREQEPGRLEVEVRRAIGEPAGREPAVSPAMLHHASNRH